MNPIIEAVFVLAARGGVRFAVKRPRHNKLLWPDGVVPLRLRVLRLLAGVGFRDVMVVVNEAAVDVRAFLAGPEVATLGRKASRQG